jgi:hypothetical protein
MLPCPTLLLAKLLDLASVPYNLRYETAIAANLFTPKPIWVCQKPESNSDGIRSLLDHLPENST